VEHQKISIVENFKNRQIHIQSGKIYLWLV